MPTVKAIGHHHGSDGYKHADQEWEVSEEEAKGLVAAGHVMLVPNVVTPQGVKEEKQPLTTKEEKASPAGHAKTITTANIKSK